jgi:uncharacterized protein (DUF433 family)
MICKLWKTITGPLSYFKSKKSTLPCISIASLSFSASVSTLATSKTMSRTPELSQNQKDEAQILNKHLRAEVGIYPQWSDADIEDLLTRYQLSEEEIAAEYRERINVFEAWIRNQAKNLTVALRTMFGECEGLTEQKILGWLKDGYSESHVAQMYKSTVDVQRRE